MESVRIDVPSGLGVPLNPKDWMNEVFKINESNWTHKKNDVLEELIEALADFDETIKYLFKLFQFQLEVDETEKKLNLLQDTYRSAAAVAWWVRAWWCLPCRVGRPPRRRAERGGKRQAACLRCLPRSERPAQEAANLPSSTSRRPRDGLRRLEGGR